MKYFKVVKDTPVWDKGAVIRYSCGSYITVQNYHVFEKIDEDENYTSSEAPMVVENSPEYFERVYKTVINDTAHYTSKEEAKKLVQK